MQWVTVKNGSHWRLDFSSNQHLGWHLVNLKYFSPFSFFVTLKGLVFYYWYIAFIENFMEIELNFNQGLPCPFRNHSFKDSVIDVFEKKMHLFEDPICIWSRDFMIKWSEIKQTQPFPKGGKANMYSIFLSGSIHILRQNFR